MLVASGTYLSRGLTFGPTSGPDDFQELVNKMLEWTEVVQKRILTPTFVKGREEVLWPENPLGKEGPSLQEFLCFDADEEGNKYG